MSSTEVRTVRIFGTTVSPAVSVVVEMLQPTRTFDCYARISKAIASANSPSDSTTNNNNSTSSTTTASTPAISQSSSNPDNDDVEPEPGQAEAPSTAKKCSPWGALAVYGNHIIGITIWEHTADNRLEILFCASLSYPSVNQLLLADAVVYAWSQQDIACVDFSPSANECIFKNGKWAVDFRLAGIDEQVACTFDKSEATMTVVLPTVATTAAEVTDSNIQVFDGHDYKESTLKSGGSTANDLTYVSLTMKGKLSTTTTTTLADDDHSLIRINCHLSNGQVQYYVCWGALDDEIRHQTIILAIRCGAPISLSSGTSTSVPASISAAPSSSSSLTKTSEAPTLTQPSKSQ
jgi:hypothetical protein